MAPTIRRARPDDRGKVVATVTAAFRDDPAWHFLTDDQYSRVAPLLAASLFEVRVATGNVWVSEDLCAVAMWNAPAKSDEVPGAQEICDHYRASAGPHAFERLQRYSAAVAAASSQTPHWYLGTLATDPTRQRQGLATAVIAPVLQQADNEDVACCLETSTDANRRFYERRGFTESIDVEIAYGPATWWLRRPPWRDPDLAPASSRPPRGLNDGG
jgi:ribosomal protein S18 acetylase RimI-like enzyme